MDSMEVQAAMDSGCKDSEAVCHARQMMAEAHDIARRSREVVESRVAMEREQGTLKDLARRIEAAIYEGKDDKAVGPNAEARARVLAAALAADRDYVESELRLRALREDVTRGVDELGWRGDIQKARSWLIRALTPDGGQA